MIYNPCAGSLTAFLRCTEFSRCDSLIFLKRPRKGLAAVISQMLASNIRAELNEKTETVRDSI